MVTYVERAVDALRRKGRVVKEYPNWRTTFHSGLFVPRGILFHHDASPFGDSPGVKEYMWRNASIAPACQFWVERSGIWWVGCGGLAYHGGAGGGWGVIPAGLANQYSFGVETDHTMGEDWPPVMMESIEIGFAAIDEEFGWDPMNSNCGHKEYAPDRKPDPDGVDLPAWRKRVKARIGVPIVVKRWWEMTIPKAELDQIVAALRPMVVSVLAQANAHTDEALNAAIANLTTMASDAAFAASELTLTGTSPRYTRGKYVDDPALNARVKALAAQAVAQAIGLLENDTIAQAWPFVVIKFSGIPDNDPSGESTKDEWIMVGGERYRLKEGEKESLGLSTSHIVTVPANHAFRALPVLRDLPESIPQTTEIMD